MALTPGTRLGVSEVTAQIGEGGMGQGILIFLNRPNIDVDSIFAFADPVR